jgi:hypothetical protein
VSADRSKTNNLNFSSRHSDCHVVISHHPRSKALFNTDHYRYYIQHSHAPHENPHSRKGAAPPSPQAAPRRALKTRLCETFERQGRCEYQVRCMFAHGSDDMRSKEMNLLDGLTTDDAIRNFAVERYGAAAVMVDPHSSILAERFKTRSCENFKRHGECSFAHRCMFAHGEEDLRTTEMNLRDGLTTEKAIKTFQSECITTLREAKRRRKRNLKKKTKVRAAKDAAALAADDSVLSGIITMPFPGPVVESIDDEDTVTVSSTFLVVSAATASTDCQPPTWPPHRYRHDPYDPVLLGSAVTARWCGGLAARPELRAPPFIRAGVMPTNQAVVLQRLSVPFPLAAALRVLRVRRLTVPRADSSFSETAPVLVLPPSRCVAASPQSVLMP